MIKGIDYLCAAGNKHGDYIDVMVKHHPEGYAAGFLMKATGLRNGIKAARALAKSGKCKVMRVHGTWHDSHMFTKRDIPQAVKYAEQVARLAEKYPEILFFFSPWLEGYVQDKLFKEVKRACKKVLPKEIKVVASGSIPKYGIFEVHHCWVVGKYIYGFDGVDMLKLTRWDVLHIKSNHKTSILFMGWTPRCNGKAYLTDNTPRKDRKHWLRRKDIKAMERLLK